MAKKNKMTKCKVCGAEIAKSAKVCPNCGAKNKKPIYKRVWFWLLIVLVIIIIAVAAGSGDEPKKVDNSNTTKKTEKKTSKDAKFTVGDTADFDGVKVTLNSTVVSNGEEYSEPDSGKYFLGAIFTIVNDSDEDIDVSSELNFEAYCDGKSMNSDLMGLDAPEWDGYDQLDGDVASGKRMAGVMAYQVPKDFKKIEIRFQPDFWGDKKVTYTFSRKDVDFSSVE